MKYSWMVKTGKKQSLFKLGSFTFLVVILVIVIGFVMSRLMVGRSFAGYSLTGTSELPAALNSSHTIQKHVAVGAISAISVAPVAASTSGNMEFWSIYRRIAGKGYWSTILDQDAPYRFAC